MKMDDQKDSDYGCLVRSCSAPTLDSQTPPTSHTPHSEMSIQALTKFTDDSCSFDYHFLTLNYVSIHTKVLLHDSNNSTIKNKHVKHISCLKLKYPQKNKNTKLDSNKRTPNY